MASLPRILQRRGGHVEGAHPFAAVAVVDGKVLEPLGNPGATFLRSAAKPFQLAVSLTHTGDPEVAQSWLAVGAASHSAEPMHVALVEAILARFDLHPTVLRCAAHPPVHMPSADAVIRSGGQFSDLHNNCSGKHAWMLAACKHQGWPLQYLPPDHPLQVRNRAAVTAWTGEEPQLATDGCGVPTFRVTLRGAARAWSVVAAAMAGDFALGDVAGSGMGQRLGAIGLAMAARPDVTSGTDRLDLLVVQGATEPMAVKIGAMGLFCLALPQRRMGIAVKIESGVGDVLGPAIECALARFAPESWLRPEPWPFSEVRNVAGKLVGDVAVQG
jgi:L-asparaginase II